MFVQIYTLPVLVTPEYALMMSFPDWGGGWSTELSTRGANDNPLTTGSTRFLLFLNLIRGNANMVLSGRYSKSKVLPGACEQAQVTFDVRSREPSQDGCFVPLDWILRLVRGDRPGMVSSLPSEAPNAP